MITKTSKHRTKILLYYGISSTFLLTKMFVFCSYRIFQMVYVNRWIWRILEKIFDSKLAQNYYENQNKFQKAAFVQSRGHL